jgi:predicted transcriptional regulator of viral defense system
MSDSVAEQIILLARERGILRPRDLDPMGIPREYLRRMQERGQLIRTGRGLYILPDSALTENHGLAEAAKRVPDGVICLLSALVYHGLTMQAPFQVWLAIGPKVWRPKVDYPPLRIVHFSGAALTSGITVHQIEGVSVRIYDPAKTVADCFKYRNKVGLDVAMEALRDCLRQRKCTVDQLWHFAEICRVQSVMRPYLEAMVQ